MNRTETTKRALPELPRTYIRREHIVQAARSLASASGSLLVEGDDGIGISAFLVELASSATGPVLYLPIKTASRITYTVPFLVSQLLVQVNDLFGDESFDATHPSVVDWRKAILRLQQFARRTGKEILFIVDGLHHIPEADARYADEIIADLLCIGVPEVQHFIGVGRNSALQKRLSGKANGKVFELMPLSREEAKGFLQANGIAESDALEVVAAARGNPGVLASACRQYRTGAAPLAAGPGGLTLFLKQEWDRFTSRLTAEELTIVEALYANVVFSRQLFTEQSLTQRVQGSESLLRRVLEEEKFLYVNDGGNIEISGTTARKLLEAELAKYRGRIIQENIALLMQAPTSKAAVELLPSFFDEAGQTRELLGYLSPEVLDLWFAQTASLNLLQRRTQLGLQAASTGKLFPEVFRFSLETSAVRCLKQGVDETRSKIALLAELGHFPEALELTQEGPTAENRTLLFAEYVRVAHSKRHPIDPVARDYLTAAIDGLDESSDRDLAIEIATAIVGAFPDLAISAIDKGLQGSERSRDLALGRLAVETIRSGGPEHHSMYANRIADSKLQAFVITLGELLGGKTLQAVRQISSEMPIRQKFLFLRNWLKNSSRNPEGVEVALYALGEIERETAYTPTAADFCDILQPAIGPSDAVECKQLLLRMESQMGLVKGQSSSVDLVRLQMYLAAGFAKFEPIEVIENRLLDTFYSIEDIADIGTKVEATAWALSIVGEAQFPEVLEEKHKFQAVMSGELLKGVTAMLANTAEHFRVAEGAVNALCRLHPGLAMALVEQFNIEHRRDEGFAHAAEVIARNCKLPDFVDCAIRCIERISSRMERTGAILAVLKELNHRPAISADEYARLLGQIECIGDPGRRADAYIWLCSNQYLANDEVATGELFNRFLEVVTQADDLTLLRPRAFGMLQRLAARHPILAAASYKEVERRLSSYRRAPRAMAVTNYYFCRIANSSFVGLASLDLDTDDHLLRIVEHFSTIPVFEWRVLLLNDLIVSLHFAGRRDLRDRLCADHLVGLLSSLPDQFLDQYSNIVLEAIPALFLWNQAVANSFVKKLPEDAAEKAMVEVAMTILRGTSLLNPHSDEKFEHRALSYDEALAVTEALEKLSTDADFVRTLESFVHALNNRLNRNAFTPQQRSGIAVRVLQHAERILPDQRNIKHGGWLIYAKLVVELLGDLKAVNWKSYELQIDALPNLSDQVLLLGTLASYMPSRMENERKALLRKAESKLRQVPSIVDRALRAVGLSSSAGANEKDLAERLLREALEATLSSDSPDAGKTQQIVVDAAYRLDERIAERLIERIDDDPARAKAKREIRERVSVHKNSHAIGRADVGKLTANAKQFGESSFKALGSLNASRSVALDVHRSIGIVNRAAQGTLEMNWAAYCWFLRSLQKRASKHPNKYGETVLALHEMLQLSAEFTSRLNQRLCGEQTASAVDAYAPEDYLIGDHGSRQEILSRIASWVTEDGAMEEVLLCDPYFKSGAMELLWMIHSVRPDTTYCVLTHLNSPAEAERLRAAMIDQWKALSDESCPPIAIVGCYFEDRVEQCPVHDRWVLGDQGGAQLGTSIADVGNGRLSAVDRLNAQEVAAIRHRLGAYLKRAKKHGDGRALRYVLASI